MSFTIEDWPSVRELDSIIGRGGTSDEAADHCRRALTHAEATGAESERIYVSGRLAELLVWKGRLDLAGGVHRTIWPGTITPAIYGFEYMKLLLQQHRDREAREVVRQMQQRLAERRTDPSTRVAGEPGGPYIEKLSVLMAEGLLEARHGDLARLSTVCNEIAGLASHLPWLPYVDTSFLEALVHRHEYEMARQILDFIATVRPKGRPRSPA